MRFLNLVAFVLPLSALAAPTFVRSTAELDYARDQFLQGLIETRLALNVTTALANAITFPPQRDVIDAATKADANLRLAGDVVTKIGAAPETQKQPSESDQFETTKDTLYAQTIIESLEAKIKGEGWHRKRNNDDDQSGNYTQGLATQLEQLRASICDAVYKIDTTVNAGLQILALQGESVKGLFDNAGVPVPAGY